MAILSKGNTYSSGDSVTSTNLNALVDSATFVSGSNQTTDNSTLEVHSSGYLQIKDGGITNAKLAAGAVNASSVGSGTITATQLESSLSSTISSAIQNGDPSLTLTNASGEASIEVGGGSSSSAYIDLKNPNTDDYDARFINQNSTLVSDHVSRVRVESAGSLGLVAGATPSTATPGLEVVTASFTQGSPGSGSVVINETGADVDFRVEDNAGNNLLLCDAVDSKVTIRKLNLSNLPTSATGLSTGDVWRNGTVLNIIA